MAEKDGVARHRDKVVDAAGQRIKQIGRCYTADDQIFGPVLAPTSMCE